MTSTDHSADFFRLVNQKFKFSLYLLKKVPAAYFSGVRLDEANENTCTASLPFRWLSQNPFRSMYFASMSMAAELTTGILAMAATWHRKPGISSLIISMEGKFFKKATGKVFFTCPDGAAIRDAVEKAISTGEPQQVTVYSRGKNAAGETVSEFYFTWSFKVRN